MNIFMELYGIVCLIFIFVTKGKKRSLEEGGQSEFSQMKMDIFFGFCIILVTLFRVLTFQPKQTKTKNKKNIYYNPRERSEL